MGLVDLVRTLDNDDFEILKREISGKLEYLIKKSSMSTGIFQ